MAGARTKLPSIAVVVIIVLLGLFFAYLIVHWLLLTSSSREGATSSELPGLPLSKLLPKQTQNPPKDLKDFFEKRETNKNAPDNFPVLGTGYENVENFAKQKLTPLELKIFKDLHNNDNDNDRKIYNYLAQVKPQAQDIPFKLDYPKIPKDLKYFLNSNTAWIHFFNTSKNEIDKQWNNNLNIITVNNINNKVTDLDDINDIITNCDTNKLQDLLIEFHNYYKNEKRFVFMRKIYYDSFKKNTTTVTFNGTNFDITPPLNMLKKMIDYLDSYVSVNNMKIQRLLQKRSILGCKLYECPELENTDYTFMFYDDYSFLAAFSEDEDYENQVSICRDKNHPKQWTRACA